MLKRQLEEEVRTIFKKPVWDKQDLVVTKITLVSVHAFMLPAEFVWTRTSVFVYEFQNNFAQFFSLMSKCDLKAGMGGAVLQTS